MRLQGQVAIITGAGRGLGQAIALAAARDGAIVVLAARTGDELDETAWLVEDAGGIALPIVTDVRNADQVQTLVQQTIARFGHLDLLVNSAGIGLRKPITQITEADWDTAMDTLAKGTFLMISACLPHLIDRRAGTIINLAAPLEKITFPGFAAYTAAKYAVEGLTRTLARELRPHKIAVYGLHPGSFADTRLVRSTSSGRMPSLLPPEIVVDPFLMLATAGGADSGAIIDAEQWRTRQKG
jgi:NAD(P)-dependent dehydrogenase (short-subunit alcohol dehydrogenase family)